MDFQDFQGVFAELGKLGVEGSEDGDALRLSVRDEQGGTRRVAIGTPPGEAAEGDGVAERIESPRESLAELSERIVSRLHLAEVALVPVTSWRDVLDVAAFELASHEPWQDMDAESTLRQNGRDPLVLLPSERDAVQVFVRALMLHGEEPKHELYVVSIDSVFIMHVRQTGELAIWCANAAAADTVRGAV